MVAVAGLGDQLHPAVIAVPGHVHDLPEHPGSSRPPGPDRSRRIPLGPVARSAARRLGGQQRGRVIAGRRCPDDGGDLVVIDLGGRTRWNQAARAGS